MAGPNPNPTQQPTPADDPIVGIDLGTTNSLVAFADERGPRVLTDELGHALLPSVVRFDHDPSQPSGWKGVVGHEPRARAGEFPERTISSAKRLLARTITDVRPDLAFLSYRVVAGERGMARIELPAGPASPARTITPEEVSARVLARLREIASRALGVPVRRAVVTVPAYFDDAQRQATRTAARLAGLEAVRIVNEPTAAALAYGLSLGRSARRNDARATGCDHAVVYDLGGGTFDVSVLRLTPAQGAGERDAFEVLATAGDTRLGGDDFDHLLAGVLARDVERRARELGISPPDPARLGLVRLAEGAKVRLSTHDSASVRVVLGEGAHLERVVTRAEFESLIGPLVERTIASCAAALRDANLLDHDARPIVATAGSDQPGVGAVILVGGSTRLPLVRARLREFFGIQPYTALDPDQVVALGAAVQASILAGTNRGSILLDVIPLSLGVETAGGAAAKVILRNSPVPARAREMFSTSVDGQTSIKLHVVQGEREMAGDCRSLGVFHLSGLPPMPAGLPQVEVTFLVDANGVLTVSAMERRTGKRAELQVVPNHGLTQGEADRIERESLEHASEDMRRHRVADLLVASRLDLKWIGDGLAKHRAALDPAYAEDLSRLADRLAMLASAGEFDWRSVDPQELGEAKSALERASLRLQEVAIAESLRRQASGG